MNLDAIFMPRPAPAEGRVVQLLDPMPPAPKPMTEAQREQRRAARRAQLQQKEAA